MATVVAQEVVPGQPAQRLLFADAPAPHAVGFEGLAEHHLEGVGAGRVHFAAPFLQDRLDLALQLVGVEQGMHQGIGFDLEPLSEIFGRQDDVIVRRIVVRAGVELAAEGLDLGRDLVGPGPVGCSFEEHVLDDVRDADFPVFFVEVAGAHPEVDGRDRRRMVLAHEHGQAIRQHFLDDLDSRRHPFTSWSSETGAQPAPFGFPLAHEHMFPPVLMHLVGVRSNSAVCRGPEQPRLPETRAAWATPPPAGP